MKNINRILTILGGWLEDYPSLVVTLLWRIEIECLEKLDMKGSTLIMRLRADAYKRIIEKYKEIDPEAIRLFEMEISYSSHCFRQMLTPEKLAEQEEKNRKHRETMREMYEKDPEMSQTVQVESCKNEAYTHVQQFIQDKLPGVKSMFDIKFANKKFDKSETRSILDILEAISYDEEKQALCAEDTTFYEVEGRCRTGYHEDSLKFRGITGYDGKQHLCPFRTVYSFFYRGQNTYFDNCLASIDRNLQPEQLFAERVKATAMEKLFSSSPAAIPFVKGQPYTLPNGKEVTLSYHIDYSALAQHYSIRTNLLDLTTDKMVAAFFACSGHNSKEDKYYAYNKNGYGVFYVYRDKNIFSKDSRISIVGLQPLSRPGAQAGYVLSMNPGEDFNTICSEAISFKHDKTIAKQIFEIVNLLGEPFVNDVMSIKAKELVGSSTFSNFDLDETVRKYYSKEESSTISKWIEEAKLSFVDGDTISFSDKDKEALEKEREEATHQLQTMVYNRVISMMKIDSKE